MEIFAECMRKARAKELARMKSVNNGLRALKAMLEFTMEPVALPPEPPRIIGWNPQRFSDSQLLEAMKKYGGNVQRVALSFGVSNGAVYHRLRKLKQP